MYYVIIMYLLISLIHYLSNLTLTVLRVDLPLYMVTFLWSALTSVGVISFLIIVLLYLIRVSKVISTKLDWFS